MSTRTPPPEEVAEEPRAVVAGRGSGWRDRLGRFVSPLRDPATVLPLVLLLAFIARGAWIDKPPGGLVFDEAYYVNAARVMLGIPVVEGANYAGSPAGLDPNTEHPELGKAAIALSIRAFGDNAVGWRVPSLIAGMIVLAAVYLLVTAAGESAWFAILIVALVAFDNLTFVHSRIATLDILVLAPILVGAWLALRDRWALAGIATGVGFLVKLTAVYGLLALLVLLAIRIWEGWQGNRQIARADLARLGAFLVTFAVVGFGGLWLLDSRLTTYPDPISHLRHMIEYGAGLKEPVDRSGMCAGATSPPWEWLFNQCQINYLEVNTTVQSGGDLLARVSTVDFRGALNPLLASAVPIASMFTLWFAWRTGNVLARWAVVWAGANWLPYVALAIVSHRVTYIYYFLPVVPAVAVAVAVLLFRAGLPRFVAWGYLLAYAVGFAAYFPFRQLP